MNAADIVIIALIVTALVGALLHLRRTKRSGGCGCGCAGCTARCDHRKQ